MKHLAFLPLNSSARQLKRDLPNSLGSCLACKLEGETVTIVGIRCAYETQEIKQPHSN